MKHLFLIALAFLTSCQVAKIDNTNNTEAVSSHAMIVSAREEASVIGINILKKGGNAFDAMVATDAALLVSYPFAGNIGGGGFMVYRLNDGTTGTLDYREKAPKKAHQNMYLDEEGNIIPRLSLEGALAIGVPGTVAGMWEAHRKYGKLPWKEVIQPAIDLAEKGIYVTKKQAASLNKSREVFQKVNAGRTIYFDKNWKEGDTIKQPNLAKTLTVIRDKGKDGFYKGEIGEKIVNFVTSQGGIITKEDLINYQPVWRAPIEFNYHDYKITTMPPPSSGGIVLGQILKILEDYNLKNYQHNSADYIQIITEAERRAYADRAHYLGDPDFVKVPIKELLDKAYLRDRMKNYTPKEATKSKDISHGKVEWVESNETTHYSIVDNYGNAISVTTTLNGAYGSKLYDNDLGFFFNNEMDDFSSKPGKPNMFGLVGGEANKIEPEKRMLSSMTPTIVSKKGKLHMVLGSPGGSTIITTVLQTILNETLFGMDMQSAVSSPRFHHQWLPDEILLEPKGFNQETKETLKKWGYNLSEKNNIILGKMDAILVLPNGELEAGADPRGDDTAAGF